MRRLIQTIGALATVLAAGAAPAALIDRGRAMIYDDVLNITWLADWNYAKTQYNTTDGAQGDADGQMDWTTAVGWANDLAYGGYDDWRLPSAGTWPRDGFGGGGELGDMFYVNWGANSGRDFSTGRNKSNLAFFSNVQSYFYWYGTEFRGEPWVFLLLNGDQGPFYRDREAYAVAVRPGDVATVPEPHTAALVLLALGVAAVVRRKASCGCFGVDARQSSAEGTS